MLSFRIGVVSLLFTTSVILVACSQPKATARLTLSAGTGGTLAASPVGSACTGCAANVTQYTLNATVTITATAQAGYAFTGFAGACAGTGPCQVVMSSDEDVSATFAPVTETLNVSLSGAGGGTVTSSPAGINCGGQCSASFQQGTSVTLTATPDASSVFVGWGGACSEATSTCTVQLSSAETVTAEFAPQLETLTVTATGPGVITSSPAGIYCGAQCSSTFVEGAQVTLAPSAQPGATFAGWGGACSGTGTCVVTLTSAQTVTASFTEQEGAVTVTTIGTGTGSVTSMPTGIDCGATCSASFDDGSIVVLTATPAAGSVFAGWTGACTGTGVCVVPETGAAAAVTAEFDPLTFTLTAGTNGAGTITSADGAINCGTQCTSSYPSGSMVMLTATPASGDAFVSWGGACSGTTPTCTVDLAASAGVTAQFAPQTASVTVVETGPGVVTSSPSGIYCGADCSATFNQGTTVTLTATPQPDATFAGWGGACSGTGACTVTVGALQSVTATFAVEQGAVTVTTIGNGSGTVTSAPAGIHCGATCSSIFAAGSLVVLTAAPDSTSVFGGWTGACTGTSACILSEAGAAAAVTAEFDPLAYPLTVATFGSGTVTSSDGQISCGSQCGGSYAAGATVTLTATAAGGNVFSSWSGACSGSASTCTVTFSQAQTVIASFAPATGNGSLETILTNGPANPTRSTSATFWFTGSAAVVSFDCSLDGATASTCTSPATYTGLSNGMHTFSVAGVSASGAVDPAPATYSWTIDTVPPITTLTATPRNPSNVTSPSFSFTSNEAGSTFTCRLDTQLPVSCTSPYTLSGLSNGTHAFTVTATDAAGNTDPTPPTYTWVVDTVPPVTALNSRPPNPSDQLSPSFSFSANKSGCTFMCTMDTGAAFSCFSPQQVGPLSNGSHTFQVAATDPAGNTDPNPPSYTWVIDTVAPVIGGLSATPYAKAGATVTVQFTVTDTESIPNPPIVTVAGNMANPAILNGGVYTSTYTVRGNEPQGTNTVSVSATDLAGNVGTGTTNTTLLFTPPSFTVTATPAYAKVGSTITITAVASKTLQGNPTATIAGTTLMPSGINGLTYTFTTVVPASATAGTQPITVTGSDLAGNQGTGTASIVYKFSVDITTSLITLNRTPYGSTKTVTGTSGATDANATLSVYQNPGVTTLLGTGTAASNGSFSISLGTADQSTVYLVITDQAGNVSAPTQPGQVLATLNFAGVASGAVGHTAYLRNRVNELVSPTTAAESGSDEVAFTSTQYNDVDAIDGTTTAVSQAPQALGWQGVKPSQASSVAMAYDNVANHSFAMISTFPELTTWAWNGTGWNFLSVLGSQNWTGFNVFWDGVNSRMMLWAGAPCCGGTIPTSYYWSGTSWTVLSPNTSPPQRSYPSITWDSMRNVDVLYGGSGYGDTWEWNGTTWNNVTPSTGSMPPAGQQLPMTYDGTHHYTMLLSGSNTWTWNGTAWTEVATTGPSSSSGDTMAWGSTMGVVFYGAGGQTWSWNGTAWTKLTTAGVAPGSLSSDVMNYDPVNKWMFLHGGSGTAACYTLTLSGSTWTWTQVNGQSPSSRYYAGLTYDATHSQTVLFGGQYAPSDTWVWNGTGWTQAQASNATIGARYQFGLASGGGEVLLSGGYQSSTGYLSDAYTWNGTTWTAVTGSTPGSHGVSAFAWDPYSTSFLLYGGQNSSSSLSNTWTFASNAWTESSAPGAPGARAGSALIAFPPLSEMILQGGNGDSDTWAWSGTAWSQLSPLVSGTAGPGVSQGTAVVYDTTRNRLILLDPSAGNYTWEWDGGTWRKATAYPANGRNNGCGMAWHAATPQAVLFCGAGSYSSGYPIGETWVYDSPRYQGEVFTFQIGSTATPTAMTLTAVVGGSGDSGGGVAASGARLLAWNAASSLWADLGTGTAADSGTQAARTITVNVGNPAQYASNGQVVMMVLPIAPAGVEASEITVDYVEADVTYP